MQFLHPERDSQLELTFSDLFIVQLYWEDVGSRLDIDLSPNSPLSTTLPIISANMNSVTGKRMSETLARYGGMGVLPQDMSLEKTLEIIDFIHKADTKFDTALTVKKTDKARDAKWIIGKRAHDAVVMVDDNLSPIGIFTNSDLEKVDQFTNLENIKREKKLITASTQVSYEQAYNMMSDANISSLPIVWTDGKLKWMMTKKDAVRWDMYKASLNKNGRLNVSVALWINSYKKKIDALLNAWIDTIVLDTAHGLQTAMIQAITEVREIVGNDIQIIAGNIVTADGTKKLLEAWANGVKVGIWPWAMCTTRMQTAVWRPQFSAIKECSETAKKLEWYVWADGGIKNPRDLALALAAGASHAMIGSILAGTYESTGDIKEDEHGEYKESHGMASWKAVLGRNSELSAIEQARRSLFQEWISTSKVYMKPWMKSVWDLLDKFTSGLRSSLAYTWVNNLKSFQEKVVIGIQSSAWFEEGKPHRSL